MHQVLTDEMRNLRWAIATVKGSDLRLSLLVSEGGSGLLAQIIGP